MEWSIITDLLDPSLFIVVAACLVLGYILKQTPRVPDWTIIYTITAFAIVATLFIQGPDIKSVLQGILCGAVAVFGHQLIKQAKGER